MICSVKLLRLSRVFLSVHEVLMTDKVFLMSTLTGSEKIQRYIKVPSMSRTQKNRARLGIMENGD